jgi:putative membrane protein
VALACLTPSAVAQNNNNNPDKNWIPLRAATLEEMNGGKAYVGMNRPSTLPNSAQLTRDALSFIRNAAMDGSMEANLGRLAEQRATSEEVRQFGHKMAEDHMKANDLLIHLATDKGLTLPAELDSQHRLIFDRVMRTEGAEFDRAYMATMVDAHRKAVRMFTAFANNGTNSDVRSWAATVLPTLRKHLDRAENLYAKM